MPPLKPCLVIANAYPAAQATFKKTLIMTKDSNIEIWNLDGSHIQQHGSSCVMWISPMGKDPILLHASARKSIVLFGVANLMTGKLLHITSTIFNAETFLEFIK